VKKSFIPSLFFIMSLLLLPFEKAAADKDFVDAWRNMGNTHFIRLAQEERADTTTGDENIFAPPPDELEESEPPPDKVEEFGPPPDKEESEEIDDSIFEPPLPPDDESPIINKVTDEFNFELRAITGVMQYKYLEKSKNPQESPDVEWRDNMPFLGIGTVFGYGNFSVDLYGQWSMTGKSGQFEIAKIRQDHNTDLSRTDYAVNIAYGIDNLFGEEGNLSLSLGYKIGETDIKGPRRRTFSTPQGIQESFRFEDTQFQTKGPTVGITYAYPITSDIVLGLNLGYAWKLETDYRSAEQTVVPDSTDGLTFGLVWKGKISNQLNYTLSMDGYQYTMTAKFIPPDTAPEGFNPTLDSIEESVISFKASLNW
jgi:hypothetical protein